MDDAHDPARAAPASPGEADGGPPPRPSGAPGAARSDSDSEAECGGAGHAEPGGRSRNRRRRNRGAARQDGEARRRLYAAVDLGTNNCRLLIARPADRDGGFEVVDAFSRIVRLGEGLAQTGALSEAAMARTIAALRICASKMRRRNVARARIVATEACRMASNADVFMQRVARETGLDLDVVTAEDEARLAVLGCAPLLDREAARALVFDIGGGSTELVWLDMTPGGRGSEPQLLAWASLPVGVVTLADRYGGRSLDAAGYAAMVAEVEGRLAGPLWPQGLADAMADSIGQGNVQLLGTSGTVTTIAGIHLDLPRYDRAQVDGTWIDFAEVTGVTRRLGAMTFDQRAEVPCIGRERADLVMAGCAILEAIQKAWPCRRLRVADRGLREGILVTMMREDRRRQRRRRNGRAASSAAHPHRKDAPDGA